eukprot:UN2803
MERMLQEMNTRLVAKDRDLQDKTITLAAEYHAFQGRAVKYVKDMKDFAKLTVQQYVPMFKDALNDGSAKISKRMLVDVSAHFEQLVQTFNDVVTKHEATKRCVDVAPGDAEGSTSNYAIAGGALFAVVYSGAMIACACLKSPPIGYISVTVGFVVLGGIIGALTMGGNNEHAQGTKRKWSDCFEGTMQKVDSIISQHEVELRAVQLSLKSVADDAALIGRLVDDWAGNSGDKTTPQNDMERLHSQFSALEKKCLE